MGFMAGHVCTSDYGGTFKVRLTGHVTSEANSPID